MVSVANPIQNGRLPKLEDWADLTGYHFRVKLVTYSCYYYFIILIIIIITIVNTLHMMYS